MSVFVPGSMKRTMARFRETTAGLRPVGPRGIGVLSAVTAGLFADLRQAGKPELGGLGRIEHKAGLGRR